MKIARYFTTEGECAYKNISFKETSSEIRNPDGSIVFEQKNFLVPSQWSQVAADVLAQKYFRKAGVPIKLKKIKEKGIPEFILRSKTDETALKDVDESKWFIGETSSKQVFNRLVGAWTYWGWKAGSFDSSNDALAYYDEMRYMLAMQMGAPNSPQWFNTGLHWAYGIDGPSQ